MNGITGVGKLMSPYGDLLYAGQLINSIPNGIGIQFSKKSSKTVPIYVGNWEHGIRNGLGLETETSSSVLQRNRAVLYRWSDGVAIHEIVDPNYKKTLLNTKKDIMKDLNYFPTDVTNLDETVDVIIEENPYIPEARVIERKKYNKHQVFRWD